jgi:NADPH2:quinone reductase
VRAVQIQSFGGPEVLQVVDLPDPEPGQGQVLVEVTSAGVNYADTHATEDSYLSKQVLPLIPGSEVVGSTPDGGRVAAFAMGGGYCQKAPVHPLHAFPVPDGVSDGQALSLLVQGLTAWHLLRTCTHLQPGETVVVHAAGGGVGTLAVQLAKAWGAGRVIGVASSADKRALATSLGADVTVDAGEADLKSALEQANDGRKVDVVLEMVGGPTFDASLAALAPFGRLATFGMASRTAPRPVDPGALMGRSRAVVGFWLAHCFARRELLAPQMAELMGMVQAGTLRPVVGGTYPLSDARRAHEDLRSRASQGKLVLDVRT